MSNYAGNAETCPVCGIAYKNFKTGFTYQDVYDMLCTTSEDPKDWRQKRPGSVLGKWFEIKQILWNEHIDRESEMN